MKDIFELKGVDAEIRIPRLNKVFALHDPNFMKKVKLHKEFDSLNLKKDEMSVSQYLEATYILNCKQVRLYLPDITDDDFDLLGESDFFALLSQVTKFAQTHFGAKLEKVKEDDRLGK